MKQRSEVCQETFQLLRIYIGQVLKRVNLICPLLHCSCILGHCNNISSVVHSHAPQPHTNPLSDQAVDLLQRAFMGKWLAFAPTASRR